MTRIDLLKRGFNEAWIRLLKANGVSTPILGEHYVICQECNAWQAFVSQNHLNRCSEMRLPDYRKKHPNAAMECALYLSRTQVTRDRAQIHLRQLNADPEQKKLRALETKARWTSGEQRQKIAAWQSEHRDEVLESARNAREHLTTTSQLHLRFKVELEKVMPGFITEYKFGWYSIDEARPDLKLAVEVDGCYWHGCVSCGYPGDTRIKAIDAKKQGYLSKRGWTLLRVAEHLIKEDLAACVARVVEVVSDDLQYPSTRS